MIFRKYIWKSVCFRNIKSHLLCGSPPLKLLNGCIPDRRRAGLINDSRTDSRVSRNATFYGSQIDKYKSTGLTVSILDGFQRRWGHQMERINLTAVISRFMPHHNHKIQNIKLLFICVNK